MLGELGLNGQIRQLDIRGMFPKEWGVVSASLFSDPVVRADSSAPLSRNARLASFSAQLDAAAGMLLARASPSSLRAAAAVLKIKVLQGTSRKKR